MQSNGRLKKINKMEQALIIGGTTGMGRATAEILLKKDIEVAIVAKNEQNLIEAKAELSKLGKVSLY
jgi:short-subunit dehydrogenase